MNINFLKFKKLPAQNKGMTLVELMVVLAIFIIVASLTIFDYGSFRSTVSTQNLANDIAISVRKAQSFAIGVHNIDTAFNYGYGVHFTSGRNTDPLAGGSKSFIMFTDIPAIGSGGGTTGNKAYDFTGNILISGASFGGGGGDPSIISPGGGGSFICGKDLPSATNECSEILKITSADEIIGIYLNQGPSNGGSPIPSGAALDIVFQRPNPVAYFCYRDSVYDSSCNTSQSISRVFIVVANTQSGPNPLQGSKTIIVSNTGQIGVE